MATFVLVNGSTISTDTWNRPRSRNQYPPGGLIGGTCWDGTAAYLREHGNRAFAPDLADEHIHCPGDHIGQVRCLAEKEDSGKIILTGHSYGGMVITGDADRVPKRIRLVYTDTALPDPDQSRFDLFLASSLDPLSFKGHTWKNCSSIHGNPARSPESISAAQRAGSPL